ncbi:unnamed protein product, partial [Ixodes persulcatus]
GDREFFKELELTEHAGQLESVLKRLASKGFGLRMYAAAGEQAKLLHADLDEQHRMDRVRHTASDAAEFNAGLAKSEQRLKGLNLVLLYYASGLKYLYEEAGSGQSDRSSLAVIDQKR